MCLTAAWTVEGFVIQTSLRERAGLCSACTRPECFLAQRRTNDDIDFGSTIPWARRGMLSQCRSVHQFSRLGGPRSCHHCPQMCLWKIAMVATARPRGTAAFATSAQPFAHQVVKSKSLQLLVRPIFWQHWNVADGGPSKGRCSPLNSMLF